MSWMIRYNVWAMLFRQSHHEHPDRVDLQMPVPNSQPPDPPCSGQKDCPVWARWFTIWSFILYQGDEGDRCLVSRLLKHCTIFSLYTIQTPHPFKVPKVNPPCILSIWLSNQYAEVIVSLYTGCTHISPLGKKCHSRPLILSLAIITLSEPLHDPWEEDSQILRGKMGGGLSNRYIFIPINIK